MKEALTETIYEKITDKDWIILIICVKHTRNVSVF
jgi:hypothetical protein